MYNFFSGRCNLELLGAAGGGLFCLGGYMGKGFNLDHLKRRGWSLVNRCFLCHLKEESIDRMC